MGIGTPSIQRQPDRMMNVLFALSSTTSGMDLKFPGLIGGALTRAV